MIVRAISVDDSQANVNAECVGFSANGCRIREIARSVVDQQMGNILLETGVTPTTIENLHDCVVGIIRAYSFNRKLLTETSDFRSDLPGIQYVDVVEGNVANRATLLHLEIEPSPIGNNILLDLIWPRRIRLCTLFYMIDPLHFNILCRSLAGTRIASDITRKAGDFLKQRFGISKDQIVGSATSTGSISNALPSTLSSTTVTGSL